MKNVSYIYIWLRINEKPDCYSYRHKLKMVISRHEMAICLMKCDPYY